MRSIVYRQENFVIAQVAEPITDVRGDVRDWICFQSSLDLQAGIRIPSAARRWCAADMKAQRNV